MPTTSVSILSSGQLNPIQREAIEHNQGPLLILAGAGSGKTRVITERIVHLIQGGHAAPWNIAAVTFTNKAAAEMRERVEKTLGPRGMRVCIRTFHSLALGILRRHGDQIGLSRSFSIADRSIQKSLIKKILKKNHIDSKQFPPNRALHHIDRAYDQLLTPAQYHRTHTLIKNDIDADIWLQVHTQYISTLRDNESIDYGGLLYYCAILLQKQAEVCAYYQNLWKYIMIDEYQDTNHSQYQIGKSLSNIHKNIMVVGDEDQSIYSWRGADIRNILDFSRDHPQVKTLSLQENYRSSKKILALANQVIAVNTQRHARKKTAFTNNPGGKEIETREHSTDLEESAWVVSQIHEDIQSGVKPKDIAIFYRINAQSRLLEEKLRQAHIPYLLIGDIRFFERREIKDILAILQVLCNPKDGSSLTRILNVPPRGLGTVALNRLTNYAEENQLSLYESLQQAGRIPSFRGASSAKKLYQMMEKWRTFPYGKISELIKDILTDTGYIESLASDNPLEKEQRASNVHELVNMLDDLESETRRTIDIDIGDSESLGTSPIHANQETTTTNKGKRDLLPNANEKEENEKNNMGVDILERLDEFLKSVSLNSGEKSEEVDENQCIRLMTLHGAKGLEFHNVWIVGLEEGYLPHVFSTDDGDKIEEERRLLYVGITRAMKKLSLSWVLTRYIFGTPQPRKCSRFLTNTK